MGFFPIPGRLSPYEPRYTTLGATVYLKLTSMRGMLSIAELRPALACPDVVAPGLVRRAAGGGPRRRCPHGRSCSTMAQVIRPPRRGVVPVASHPIREVGSRAPRARPAAPASAGPPILPETPHFSEPRIPPKPAPSALCPDPPLSPAPPSPTRVSALQLAPRPCRGSEGDSARRRREDGRGPWGRVKTICSSED